jgi:hypothetical protein
MPGQSGSGKNAGTVREKIPEKWTYAELARCCWLIHLCEAWWRRLESQATRWRCHVHDLFASSFSFGNGRVSGAMRRVIVS